MNEINTYSHSIKTINKLRNQIKKELIIKDIKFNNIKNNNDMKIEINKEIVRKYRNSLIGFK